jgi:hypothetical protein
MLPSVGREERLMPALAANSCAIQGFAASID